MPHFLLPRFLRESFQLLNSIPVLVFLAAMLETSVFRTDFHWLFDSPQIAAAALVLLAAVQIFVYSGIYGVLLELISGESVVVTPARIIVNAKQLWKIYFVVASIPVLLHFFVNVFLARKVPLALINSHGDLIFSCILAYFFFERKYRKFSGVSSRTITVYGEAAAALIGLSLVNIFLHYLPAIAAPWASEFSRLGVFTAKYFHFWGFILLALAINRTYPEVNEKQVSGPEIYLINPVGGGLLMSLGMIFVRDYPSWFMVLKALTPPGYRFREFNRIYWHSRAFTGGKLVAISCATSNSCEAYRIAKEFKRLGSTVIMGGPHVSVIPSEALEFCDSVVVGEAEGVWPQVMADFEQNRLQSVYSAPVTQEGLNKVHDFLLHSSPAVIRDCMETTRGCKFRCHFCSIPKVGKAGLRHKPVEEVLDLAMIVRRAGGTLNFLDNNIYSDPAYTRQLLEALRPLRIPWVASSSIDIGQDETVLALLKRSRCRMLLIGYEISADSEEKRRGGKLAMAHNYLAMTQNIKKQGVWIKGQFIIGFDTDSLKSLWRLWLFCGRLRPAIAGLSAMTPFPGSQLFDDMLHQGRITSLNWRNYTGHRMLFTTQGLPTWVFAGPVYLLLHVAFFLTSSGGLFLIFLVCGLFYFSIR